MDEPCPKCGECLANGYRFCTGCGRRLDVPGGDCPACPLSRANGYNYCIGCGRPLTPSASPSESPDQRYEPEIKETGTVYLISILLSIGILVFVSVVSIVFIFAHLNEALQGMNVAYFAFLFIIYALCLGYAIRHFVMRLMVDDDEERNLGIMNSGLAGAGFNMAFSMLVSLVILNICSLIEPVEPSFLDEYTDYQLAVLMLMAGPEEELIFRILPIGLPMAIICLIKGRDHCAKYLVGGFGMSQTALVLIVVSAIIFGLAHIEGWSLLKVPQIVICGLIDGYVFVTYGVYATVIAHSAFDSLSTLDCIAGGVADASCIMLLILGIPMAVLVLKHLDGFIHPEPGLGKEPPETLRDMWRLH